MCSPTGLLNGVEVVSVDGCLVRRAARCLPRTLCPLALALVPALHCAELRAPAAAAAAATATAAAGAGQWGSPLASAGLASLPFQGQREEAAISCSVERQAGGGMSSPCPGEAR